jgi:alanine racemase
MTRPTEARLDLSALRHNAQLVRELCPSSKILAVVKANAYGHGAVPIARELETLADALAVACLEEARELRDAGITAPILLLEGVFDASELGSVEELGLWLTIASEQQLAWLEDYKAQAPLTCWLKVNTGMNRLGVPAPNAASLYRRLQKCAAGTTVLYTHFASADCLESEVTPRQIAAFESLALDAPPMAR